MRGDGFTFRDVIYHRPVGEALQARLYVPERLGPWPAIIDLHGGRWCAEDRLTNAAIDAAFASAGIFVMAPDFRMPPLAAYPASVSDINFAMRWLHASSAELGIRPDWIAAVGTSSGGHQLMLNILRPDRFTADHPSPTPSMPALACAIFCWPVSDPLARYRYALARGMTEHVDCHQAYFRDETTMSAGSPQRILDEERGFRLPPAQMIQGDADSILAPGMTDRFVQSWRMAGGAIDDRRYHGVGHTFITKAPDTPVARDALGAMIAFTFAHTRHVTSCRDDG